MKRTIGLVLLALLLGTVLLAPAASAVTLGQMDTFENGTTQNWLAALLGAPHPFPPVNVPSGGPAGADDNYLLVTSVGGNGPGSRLSVINAAQWAGDYLAAGISHITMSARNFGQTDLSLRLLFEDPVFGPPTNAAFSTVPILLPAGGDWTTIVFPVTPADLTAELGDVTSALSGATLMRIYHGAEATFPGEPVVAQLGVDNIQAPVPEPATVLLLGVGLGLCAFLRRK